MPTAQCQRYQRRYSAILSLALIAATVVPIGIHTIMLDRLGITYLAAFPHGGWAPLPDHEAGRMRPSNYYDRIVDVMQERGPVHDPDPRPRWAARRSLFRTEGRRGEA